MTKKDILIGFIVGLITNFIGLYFAASYFGKGDDFTTVLQTASNEGFLGKLISLGALLNLIAFFIFIRKKYDYRAGGVLIATILIALFTIIYKYL
jgi:hypothetical protein